MTEFIKWPKIQRLYDPPNGLSITEKIDGTNAAIHIEDGQVTGVQSRKRLIAVDSDNYGFASWVSTHRETLVEALNDGVHFGEWWGSGIQRGYGLPKGDRKFSLFNAVRWGSARDHFESLGIGLSVVPELYRGSIEWFGLDQTVDSILDQLENEGSHASPGFDRPEGVVVYMIDSRTAYKVVPERWAPGSKKDTRG